MGVAPVAGVICCLLGACVTTTDAPDTSGAARPAPSPEIRELLVGAEGADANSDERSAAPPTTASTAAGADDRTPIESYSGRARAEVQPLGTIPYDNMTLPLASPDGRHLATQTGIAPDWDTILAAPGAMPPFATRIEIYTLPDGGADPPQMTATVPESALLGRSCDDEGFLIEAPRADGTRWIGRAAWDTGEVTWLVREDGAVSAFATRAADGSLAWSSVGLDGEHFELVVRRDGREWRLPARGNDWLMPTWSATTNRDGTHGLFALMLRGDMMDAVHMDASSEERAYRTIQRLPLANRNAGVQTAYQTVNAHITIPGAPAADHDTLPFLHPTRLRCAVWTPPGPAALFDAGSFAVAIDASDPSFVLMSTMKDLVRRRIDEGRSRTRLIAGPHVARPTPGNGGYVLLNPLDGVIGVTRMRLLGP